jgi:hypothetical protein
LARRPWLRKRESIDEHGKQNVESLYQPSLIRRAEIGLTLAALHSSHLHESLRKGKVCRGAATQRHLEFDRHPWLSLQNDCEKLMEEMPSLWGRLLKAGVPQCVI